MPVRSVPFVALLTMSLVACQEPAPPPPSNASPPEASTLSVTIDAMDNVTHVLSGHLRHSAPVTRVELSEDSRRLGEARLQEDGWSLEWRPEETSQALEVVARDETGHEARTRLEFQHRRFEDPHVLYGSETLLSLPTSASTTTHYTLDGSTPTPASPVYERPLVILSRQGQSAPLSLIPTTQSDAPEWFHWLPPQGPVTLATLVRVQAYQDTTPLGASQSQTYLTGMSPYSLPVLSLVTDVRHFFDDETGIYVPGKFQVQDGTGVHGNFMEGGKEWERPVHVEWFETSGQAVLAQNAGVRIHGTSSSALPQKSLRLYAKNDYGPELLSAPFFPDDPLHDFKRIVLRTSGQDSLATKLRDCTLQGLLGTTSLSRQACRRTLVFLDGEYWGLYEVRERYDEYYFSSHYGVDKDSVIYLNQEGSIEVGLAEDATPYLALLDFARTHDLSNPEHYAHVKAQIDVEDFTDYVISQVYIGNADWPGNNIRLWRTRTGVSSSIPQQDGRWRWPVFDLDFAMTKGPDVNDLKRALEDENSLVTVLLVSMLRSPEFKARFVSRFLWHLEHTFPPERVLGAIEAAQAQVAPEMPEHIRRWGRPGSLESWREEVAALRDFATRRPARMRQFLEEKFGPLGSGSISRE